MGFLEIIWNLQQSLWACYHCWKRSVDHCKKSLEFSGTFFRCLQNISLLFMYEVPISQLIEYETIIEILFLIISRLWKLKRLPAKRKKLQQFKCVKGKVTSNELLLPLRLNEVNNAAIDRKIKRFYCFSRVASNRLCLSRLCKTKYTGLWIFFLLASVCTRWVTFQRASGITVTPNVWKQNSLSSQTFRASHML